MPFEKVETQVDFPAQERAVLELWQRAGTFERLRDKNRGKPTWSFLDGPITANNPMGVHHAWGRTYKDAYQRYFAMTGHELRYQNGFDCQGLWVEVEVEKELGLKSKRDIENLVPGNNHDSIEKFVQLCKERVDKFARVQTNQSIRLGYWMDWDRDEDWRKPPDQRRSYFTMSDENNYTIWSFLKKCHKRGYVYRGYDAMPWCPRCSVGLSQMEMAEGYQMVAHRSVFVRFPLRGKTNESLLIWTTTPWTLTSNVAAAVNPDLTYLKVLHKDQIYYVAKGAFTFQRLEEQWKKKEWVQGVPKLKTLEQIFKEKGGYEIVGEVAGQEMIGWPYEGPFDELRAQQDSGGFPHEIGTIACRRQWAENVQPCDVHRVIAWEKVGETEGTGIVHIAPGCGKEDFQLGRTERLPPIAPLDEYGVFLPGGFDDLDGRSALDPVTTDLILANLKQKGILLEVERYPHSYPHCWRCKTELLFRLIDEWFIHMPWRDKIMDVVLAKDRQGRPEVTFLPESINGKARELDWLTNMGDWMISKKRFWGLALPIWACECGHFEVIGSRTELYERAIAGWDRFEGHSPHRPWVDEVKIKCEKCGVSVRRISDVGNPWLDAGVVPFSTMQYNTEFHPDDPERTYWKKWFPADFITECFPGQFRNWFYAILAMGTMMTWGDSGDEFDLPSQKDQPRAPFRVLLGHGLVRDQWDRPMSKSGGNAIPFEGAADEGYDLKDPKGSVGHYPPMSADLIRWMFARTNPALNINFGPGPAEELHSKFRSKLWNSYRFFCDNARLPVEKGGFDVHAPQVPVGDRPDFDRWILSDLQKLVRTAREEFQAFNVAAFCQEAEAFVDEKLSNWWVRRNKDRFWEGEPGQSKLAAYQTLYTVLVTLAKLFAPIIPFLTESMYRNLVDGPEDRSVHLCAFPEADKSLIDEELSQDMDALLRVKAFGSAARNTVKLKVRQPLAEMKVQPANDGERRAVERFANLLCEELNIKKVTLHDPRQGSLVALEFKINPKSLGARGFGQQLAEIQKCLAAADLSMVAGRVQAGQYLVLDCASGLIKLEPGDVFILPKAAEGWTGTVDRGTQVLLDTRVTPELAREGMAREVVRHVQNSRKEAGLEMEDRIELFLGTEDKDLQEAIGIHRAYIAAETLAARWSDAPLGSEAF